VVKHDLIENLVKAFPGITREDMSVIVDTLFESMAQALMGGEAIELRGLGRLKIKKRQPMKGRNPRTGTVVNVPTRWVPHFKPAESLTNRINQALQRLKPPH
jgi:integration host factor subunit beta